MTLNKIQIIGRLTKQPELKALPSGAYVSSFSVATEYVYKDKQGVKQSKPTFHNVVAFGRTAEVIAQYFVKGQEIYIEGRQEHRSYEKADGTKGYASEIITERFDFGAKPKADGDKMWSPADNKEKTFEERVADLDTTEYPDEEINLADIPF